MNNPSAEHHAGRRVLHVVSDLEAAGITPWLIELVRQQARMGWTADICLLARKRGAMAGLFEAAGCRIFRCAPALGTLVPLRVWQLLASRGPHNVVHAHLSGGARKATRIGLCLAGARLAGVAVRAVHLHTACADDSGFGGGTLLRKFATVAISPSRQRSGEWTGLTLSGGPPVVEAAYGFNLGAATEAPLGRFRPRDELGIPRGVPVIGMIAREPAGLSTAEFFRIAEEVLRILPHARFVLAADQSMRRWFAGRVRIMGLEERAFHVKRPVNPHEIPDGLFDVLLAPLSGGDPPLLLLKAQAAGLLVALHGLVEPEYVVLPQSVARVAEGSGVDGWAAAAVSLAGRERLSRLAACNLVAARGFDAADACRRVLEIYEKVMLAGGATSMDNALAGAASGKSGGGWYA